MILCNQKGDPCSYSINGTVLQGTCAYFSSGDSVRLGCKIAGSVSDDGNAIYANDISGNPCYAGHEEQTCRKLTDVSFVIPVRIDSPERSRNLDILIDFLIQNFDSKVFVMELDDRQRYFVKNNHHRIQYFFELNHHRVFHHTLVLNHLYRKIDTPVMAVWDTDMLAAPEQIMDAVAQIRKGNAVISLPYDGHAYQTTAELALAYQETRNFDVLTHAAKSLWTMYGESSVGGAFIVHTEKYLQAGGENEYFLGWGPEDCERVKRMEILYPQPVFRSKGGLFHLWHPRGLNSGYADSQYEINGKKEFLKVCGMTASELRHYVNSWPWLENSRNKYINQ